MLARGLPRTRRLAALVRFVLQRYLLKIELPNRRLTIYAVLLARRAWIDIGVDVAMG